MNTVETELPPLDLGIDFQLNDRALFLAYHANDYSRMEAKKQDKDLREFFRIHLKDLAKAFNDRVMAQLVEDLSRGKGALSIHELQTIFLGCIAFHERYEHLLPPGNPEEVYVERSGLLAA